MLILRPVTRECQPASILLGCREFRLKGQQDGNKAETALVQVRLPDDIAEHVEMVIVQKMAWIPPERRQPEFLHYGRAGKPLQERADQRRLAEELGIDRIRETALGHTTYLGAAAFPCRESDNEKNVCEGCRSEPLLRVRHTARDSLHHTSRERPFWRATTQARLLL